MELVPIIYTALAIFAVLAVGTIVISYILFKIRGNENKGEEDKIDLIPTITSQPPAHETHEVKKNSGEDKKHNSSKHSHPQNKKRKPEKPKSKKQKPAIPGNKRIKILNQITPTVIDNLNLSADKVDYPNTTSKKKTTISSEDDSEFYKIDTSGKNKTNI